MPLPSVRAVNASPRGDEHNELYGQSLRITTFVFAMKEAGGGGGGSFSHCSFCVTVRSCHIRPNTLTWGGKAWGGGAWFPQRGIFDCSMGMAITPPHLFQKKFQRWLEKDFVLS